jgi:enoyl-CoA hydratase
MPAVSTEMRDGIAILTLDAADRRNAIDGAMARELCEGLRHLEATQSVGAIVLTGAPPVFCAGADRRILAGAGEGDEAAIEEMRAVYEAISALGRCLLPTIAAVGGAAVGAGLNLALAADLCVVTRTARLVSGFRRIDIHPGGGHHFLLQRKGGLGAARALALFDLDIDGERAVELGLAWEAVDDGVLDRACELAQAPATHPALSRSVKRTFRGFDPDSTWNEQIAREAEAQLQSLRDKKESDHANARV